MARSTLRRTREGQIDGVYNVVEKDRDKLKKN